MARVRGVVPPPPTRLRRPVRSTTRLVIRDTPCNTLGMPTRSLIVVLGTLFLFSTPAFRRHAAARPAAAYAEDTPLEFPEHYREWVYLSTGFDMSYQPAMQAGHHAFDNVFVNPEAYKSFVETGTWPDKTVLVLEVRGAESRGSINRGGNYQGTAVMGLEVHVKDQTRFPGRWAFIAFDAGRTAKMIPASADCYSCHAEHGAVDTTFVQFYPTLLSVAESKGTLSNSYRSESGTPRTK